MTLFRWDKATPGNNATADATINWAEGMAPSAVNDSARGMMTAVAKYRDDINGTITTGGTSTAYTVTSNQVFTTLALMNGAMIAFIPHTNCGATVTLNVDTLGAKPLRTSPGVELAANSLIAGTPYAASYNNSSAVWYLQNVYNIPAAASSIITSMIADDNVTYAKIQNVANLKLLGNFSGGAADVSEYTIAGGLSVTGTVLTGSMAVQGGFKNLVIKVATNTTVTVTADYVVMLDTVSGNTRTVAISSTLNFANVGVVNGIDATGIAIDKEYHVWAISNGTTDGVLASLSSTAPAMPSGYTWKARIGALMTQHASAILYGTWQFGRKVQYIQGLAGNTPNTSTTPGLLGPVSTGTASIISPTLVAKTAVGSGFYVPTTASHIHLIANSNYKAIGASVVNVAPSQSYSGTNNGAAGSTGLMPPYSNSGSTSDADSFWMMLESTAVSIATGSGGVVGVLGWEDAL